MRRRGESRRSVLLAGRRLRSSPRVRCAGEVDGERGRGWAARSRVPAPARDSSAGPELEMARASGAGPDLRGRRALARGRTIAIVAGVARLHETRRRASSGAIEDPDARTASRSLAPKHARPSAEIGLGGEGDRARGRSPRADEPAALARGKTIAIIAEVALQRPGERRASTLAHETSQRTTARSRFAIVLRAGRLRVEIRRHESKSRSARTRIARPQRRGNR